VTSRQPLTSDAVLTAADKIVQHYGQTDADRYFACFDPAATFVFHTEPYPLGSRSEYEQAWAGWVADGWSVIECASLDRSVQVFEDTAVFCHTVHTVVSVSGNAVRSIERETIVFVRGIDGRLTAVHEHLSPVPAD
jgi:ketosteroid isomerase-like protein